MISLGYEKGSKAYKFMQNNTIFISDNAIFDENNFPRRNKTSSSKLIESPPGITTNSKWDKTVGYNDHSNPNKQLDSDSENERPTHYNHHQNCDTTYDDNRCDSSHDDNGDEEKEVESAAAIEEMTLKSNLK